VLLPREDGGAARVWDPRCMAFSEGCAGWAVGPRRCVSARAGIFLGARCIGRLRPTGGLHASTCSICCKRERSLATDGVEQMASAHCPLATAFRCHSPSPLRIQVHLVSSSRKDGRPPTMRTIWFACTKHRFRKRVREAFHVEQATPP